MASTIKVDKLDPQSGTALEIGTSGDTVTVPSGVGLTLTDSTLLLPTTVTATTEVKTNKISPATGVAFAMGDSGDTFTIPSGATISNLGTATGFGGDNTPSFFAYVSADYTITDANHSLIAADTEVWDTDSAYTNTAGNYKFTVPVGAAGKYQFTIGYKVTHTVDQSIQVSQNQLYKNGVQIIRTASLYQSSVYFSIISQNSTFTVDLAESDYMQAYNYIDNAHSTDMTVVGGGSPILSWFSGFKLIT
jgi:hypothetical protein